MHTRVLEVERSTSTAHRLSQYDGVCGNIHGHNMKWEASVTVEMTDDSANMPVDLKTISSLIDDVDHAVILNQDDELVRFIIENREDYDHTMFENNGNDGPFVASFEGFAFLGLTYLFDGDPTCELLSKWMLDRILEIDPVIAVDLTVYETDKYGVTADQL